MTRTPGRSYGFPEYLTSAQAGQYMGVSANTARLVIRALAAWYGLALRQQCGIRVRRSELEDLLDRLAREGQAIAVDKSGDRNVVRIGPREDTPPALDALCPDTPRANDVPGHREWVG